MIGTILFVQNLKVKMFLNVFHEGVSNCWNIICRWMKESLTLSVWMSTGRAGWTRC